MNNKSYYLVHFQSHYRLLGDVQLRTKHLTTSLP